MSDIKSRVQGMEPDIKARDVSGIAATTGNIYEVINVIARRAENLSQDLKVELHGKLKEFAVTSETIEEVQENKEQIEISKFYERLPNSVVIATEEYLEGALNYELNQEDNNEE